MDWVAVWKVVSKLEVAFVTLIAGFLIARLVGKIVGFVLKEAELNSILESAGFHPWNVEVGLVVERLLQGVTLIVVLQQFDIARVVLELLGAMVGILLLIGLILSVRNIAPNLAAYLLLRKKLKSILGESVSVGSVSGKVVKVGFVRTWLEDTDVFVVSHRYALKNGIKPIREG